VNRLWWLPGIVSWWVAAVAVGGEGGDAATAGKLVVEPPTLICLGFQWHIAGDDNRNAAVAVRYRRQGEAAWHDALPLLRTSRPSEDPAAPEARVRLLAGSILDLRPDTAYECRLAMSDPDGVTGEAVRQVTVRTRAAPKPFEGGRVRHVYPVGHKGPREGTTYRNLLHAYYDSRWDSDTLGVGGDPVGPGDTIVVHAGVYKSEPLVYHQKHGTVVHGGYTLTRDGTPEKPITIRAAGDGPVVFDGSGCYRLFDVTAADHHILAGLTLRNTEIGIFAGLYNAYGCDGLVVRDCVMTNINIGVLTQFHGSDSFVIEDNWFIGRFDLGRFGAWGPVRSYFAVKVNGSGHIVCHNYAAGFYDGIDVLTEHNLHAGKRCAIDVYNNDLFRMNDNFLEADGATHNVRFLRNRGIDCGSIGISNQPVHGGPVYWIRNISYNAGSAGAIKNLANPDGFLAYHNTITGNLTSWGTPTYGYADYRNNLFLGHGMDSLPSRRGKPSSTPVIAWASTDPRSILDYNGYRLGTRSAATSAPFEWLDPRHPSSGRMKLDSFDAFRRRSGLEPHGRAVDFDVFQRVPPVDYAQRQVHRASDLDFRLKPASAAVDAGCRLPNVNDGFTGKAPDLGACELGQPSPHYGPRTKRTLESVLEQAAAAPRPVGSAATPYAASPPRLTVADANGDGTLESITVGAHIVKAERLVTGTARSAAVDDMSRVQNLSLRTGVYSPGGAEWAFDVTDFGGGLWKDTNGAAPDFFIFECGGNDDITVAALLADGTPGKAVRIHKEAWSQTGMACPVAGGDAAGIALCVTDLRDAKGLALRSDAPIKGLRITSSPHGIDPLSVCAVASKR